MFFWNLFKYGIFKPLVVLGFRARIIGRERIPREGGAILAPNHIATMDSIVLPAMVSRVVTFPVKAEIFKSKSLGGRIVAWFLTLIKMVPMERGGGRASASSLQAIADVLEDGNLVAIYPEGTRSPDGRLYKGHTGIARMGLMNDVPIIPIGIVGSQTVKGLFGIPWVRRPIVIIGEPLHFPEYIGSRDIKIHRFVTDEIMAAVQQLTGQRYVDVYGSRVKKGDMTAEELAQFELERPGGGERPPAPAPPPESKAQG